MSPFRPRSSPHPSDITIPASSRSFGKRSESLAEVSHPGDLEFCLFGELGKFIRRHVFSGLVNRMMAKFIVAKVNRHPSQTYVFGQEVQVFGDE